MSAIFDRFLSEHQATGRAKLDGYTLEGLETLEGQERQDVIAILKSEILHNAWGVEALAQIDRQEAVEALKSALGSWSPEQQRSAFQTYFWLWQLTNEDAYAQKFCLCRLNLREDQENKVIEYYSHAARGTESPTITAMLKQAVLTETNDVGLSTAIRALLAKHGISFQNQQTKAEFIAKRKILIEGSLSQKTNLLAQL